MKHKRSICLYLITVLALFVSSSVYAGDNLFTPISKILENPDEFHGDFVSVSGFYSGWKNAPGSPPVSRSDWVLCDKDKNAIYCTGKLPQNPETGAPEAFWKPMTVLAKVKNANGMPYLEVAEVKALAYRVEQMVSVAQVLFNPIESQGKFVGLHGVLAKGYGVKGDRMYLLADPTGAVKLGRLPKLYPTGTILHIRGIVNTDENGLPIIDKLEIIAAKVILD